MFTKIHSSKKKHHQIPKRKFMSMIIITLFKQLKEFSIYGRYNHLVVKCKPMIRLSEGPEVGLLKDKMSKSFWSWINMKLLPLNVIGSVSHCTIIFIYNFSILKSTTDFFVTLKLFNIFLNKKKSCNLGYIEYMKPKPFSNILVHVHRNFYWKVYFQILPLNQAGFHWTVYQTHSLYDQC